MTNASVHTATATIAFTVKPRSETNPELSVVYDDSAGNATGAGSYADGTTVTLTAEAKDGHVFAGWYSDESYATPLALDVDYRTASVTYVMSESNATVYARFISAADDYVTIAATNAIRCVTGAKMDPVKMLVESATLPSVTADGLPPGLELSLTKAHDEGLSYITISGTPAESGVYNVSVSVATDGGKRAEAAVKFVVRKVGEAMLDVGFDKAHGNVTGAGFHVAGEVVSLKATALDGYVFAGWYSDESHGSPLALDVDYRTASVDYAMPESNTTVHARFIPEADDSVTIAATNVVRCSPGKEMEPVKILVESATLPSVNVEGLPEGLVFEVAKAHGNRFSFVRISGCPTEVGVYGVSISVTTAGGNAVGANVKLVVREPGVAVLDVAYDKSLGRVTGSGVYAPGKKASLRATALRGNIFAGWYTDATFKTPFSLDVDYRTPSVSYVLPDDNIIIYAKFIPTANDYASVTATVSEEYATGEEIAPIVLDIEAGSLPKVSVKGLPSGLKFTAKALSVKATKKTEAKEYAANTIYGTPKKSGIYTATVTVTTAGKAKAKTALKFTVRKSGETKFDVDWDSACGKATGAGIYAAGKKVALKATALKGHVFAGWYSDASYETPLSLDADYRTPSLSYVMSTDDTVVYAKFIPTANDYAEVSANVAEEYATREEIAPIVLDIESGSLPKVTVKGLPSGLKFTAKALSVKATKKTEAKEYAANTIYGTPTKSGIYTATVTVTTAGKAKAKATLKFAVRKSGETKFDVDWDSACGKVTGAGLYAAGKKVKLKATALKGHVFAGWYSDASYETPLSLDADYRTPSLSYVMPTDDTVVYAKFVAVDEDSDLSIQVDESYEYNEFVAECPFMIPVVSASIPKITVSGLPKGLKYDAKSLSIIAGTGTPSPGTYEVTIKATNATVKKAESTTFDIVVANLTGANDLFVKPPANGAGDRYVVLSGFDMSENSPSLELKDESKKLKVSGLPAGVRYDVASAKLVGSPTKVGVYTVTLTVDGSVSTFTLVVEGIPGWIVGSYTFNMKRGRGDGTNYWWLTREEMSITSDGKVSGKGWGLDGVVRSWTASLSEHGESSGREFFALERGLVGVDGSNYVLRVSVSSNAFDGVSFGQLSGALRMKDSDARGESATVSGGNILPTTLSGSFVAPTFPTSIVFTNELGSSDSIRARVWFDNDQEFLYRGKILLAFGTGRTVRYQYVDPDGVGTSVGSAYLSLGEVDASVFTSEPEAYRTTWHFAATFAPVDRAAFIAFYDVVVKGGSPAPKAEDIEVHLREISTEYSDPYYEWAFGDLIGFHWLHSTDGSNDDGYFEVGSLAAARKQFSLIGSALMGAETVNTVYAVDECLGHEETNVFFRVYNGPHARMTNEIMEVVAERATIAGHEAVEYFGSGFGYTDEEDAFDSDMFFMTSLWDDDEIIGDLPQFSSSNRRATMEIALAGVKKVVGYDRMLASFEFGTNGTVTAQYYDISISNRHSKVEKDEATGAVSTNYYYVVSTNVMTGAYVYLTDEDRSKGRRTHVNGVTTAKLAVYDYDIDPEADEPGWSAYLFLSGLAKGSAGTASSGKATFFSVALDVFIPMDGNGLGDAANATFTLLNPEAFFDEEATPEGKALIYPADVAK